MSDISPQTVRFVLALLVVTGVIHYDRAYNIWKGMRPIFRKEWVEGRNFNGLVDLIDSVDTK